MEVGKMRKGIKKDWKKRAGIKREDGKYRSPQNCQTVLKSEGCS